MPPGEGAARHTGPDDGKSRQCGRRHTVGEPPYGRLVGQRHLPPIREADGGCEGPALAVAAPVVRHGVRVAPSRNGSRTSSMKGGPSGAATTAKRSVVGAWARAFRRRSCQPRMRTAAPEEPPYVWSARCRSPTVAATSRTEN